MKKITFALIALFALSGCARPLGATSPYETRTATEMQMRNESMYRGVVKLVVPDNINQEEIAAFEGDEEKFKKTSGGLTFAKAAEKEVVFIDWWKIPGGVERHSFYADKKWDLQPGDIVDFLPSRFSLKNNAVRVIQEAPLLCWGVGIWRVCRGEHPVLERPGAVLGIVCRDDEPGCSYNSSPETKIGIGRRMLSPAEYRGVEAESQQPIWDQGITFAEFWGVNACVDCTEEDGKLILIEEE